MAIQRQMDLREYHLMTGSLATGGAAATPIAFIPIPVAGQVVRCVACCQIAGDADQVITFELSGVLLTSGGATASMTLENADVLGDIQKIEFDPLAKVNLALEPIDGDDIPLGGTLEIISDGAGTVGAYIFTVTIRP